MFQSAMQCVRGQQLTQGAQYDPENCMVFDLVKDFLQKAGQGPMVQQVRRV